MIDVQSEQVIKLAAAPGEVPGRPNLSTIYRWHLRGVRGVRLETILIGGTRFTSREALQRFFDRTTAAAAGETISNNTSTPKQRAKAIEQAERDCAAAGI